MPPDKFSKEKTDFFNIPVFKNDSNESIFGYTDKARVSKECITISARGTLGVVTYKNQLFFPAGRLITLIPKEDIAIAKYLKFVVTKDMFVDGGSVIPQLTVPQISSIKITIPPIEKQREILGKIEVLESKIKECNSKISNLQDATNLIMQKYLIES